eukprot:478353_1
MAAFLRKCIWYIYEISIIVFATVNTILSVIITHNYHTNNQYHHWLFISSMISFCLNHIASIIIFIIVIKHQNPNKWKLSLTVCILLILSPLAPYIIYILNISSTIRNKCHFKVSEPSLNQNESQFQKEIAYSMSKLIGFCTYCILFVIPQLLINLSAALYYNECNNYLFVSSIFLCLLIISMLCIIFGA